MSSEQTKRLDRVVYILGTGFSAPLGLPVMSNFLEKSKDMFALAPDRYGNFANVFKTINGMYKSKGYYTADLFNIEEILSILEMSEQLGHEDEKSSFVQYIVDVIQHFTPQLTTPEITGAWTNRIFGRGNREKNIQNQYGYFVSCLLNLAVSRNGQGDFFCNPSGDKRREALYSVITLNYDMVLENFVSYLGEYFGADDRIGFSQEVDADHRHTPLAKLHGSAHTNVIVPPTWNKGLNEQIRPAWRLAFKLLSEANHVRIIGYSLPVADAYVKYLLKAAIIHCEHLKSIDVLCLDGDGSVEKRYEEFISFPKRRFRNASVIDYIHKNYAYWTNANPDSSVIHLNGLEKVHSDFFS